MRANELLLRCYAERKHGIWQAFCIDLNLAAQGDSFEEVRKKLEDMVFEYVYDAVAGEHREHAEYLLNRKAPLYFRAKWHFARAASRIARLQRLVMRWCDQLTTFKEPLPLLPQQPKVT